MISTLFGFALSALLAQDPQAGSAQEAMAALEAHAVEFARTHAGHARLGDGSPLPVATEEDRRLFAVPPALESQTVRRGFLTGQLEFCEAGGIDLSYMPYMQRLRASGRYSDRQMAYLGVLHGVSQQMAMSAMEETRFTCTDDFRAELRAATDEFPVLTP